MSDSGKLLDQLRSLWRSRRREENTGRRRTVPPGDDVGDRWERAKTLGWGEGSSVYDSCLIVGEVSVGENTCVGPFTVLDGSGGLTIGSGCNISAGSQIYTNDRHELRVGGGDAPIERKPTVVGNNVFIGPKAIIGMGVTVGDGAAIGAHSLVIRDVPAGAKVFDSPAEEQAPRGE